ncbi:MAG TPA: Uma2 family endonuclease [Gemmatimonadales bacterium]|nr:Uma2 family endonuclease [Gemmatimonadales bacterium]
MPNTAERWTATLVRALPDDGRRYELINGELVVTPAPRGIHQVAIAELMQRFHQALAGSAVHMLHSPADLALGEDEILQPDLFAYRTATGRVLSDWSDITALVLAIEVLSPSSARYDRQLKRRRYQRAGVPQYWIVDLDARLIERWRPEDARPEILAERVTWESGDGAAVDLDLEQFFRVVWGE